MLPSRPFLICLVFAVLGTLYSVALADPPGPTLSDLIEQDRPIADLNLDLHSESFSEFASKIRQVQLTETNSITGEAGFDISQILSELQASAGATVKQLDSPWWQSEVQNPMETARTPYVCGLNDLIQLALINSAQIRVYEITPEIRATAVTQAASAFDWHNFLDTVWQDFSEPVGSSLTVGGNGDRYSDHNWVTDGGFRRKTETGGSFELYQRIGHQNTNSQFFVPNNQASTRLVLGYTQPLLRGSGKVYNRSLIVLAQIDVGRARDETERQLQQHLLEVARGYWSLYLERANLAQKVRLFVRTREVAARLQRRRNLDAGQTQVIQAQAALESRRADLIRAQAAMQNAETRLRTLINAPELTPETELIPMEPPVLADFTPSLESEVTVAIQHRPEIAAALKEIRAACIRLRMAKHEMLPVLNLVTNGYLSGLRGDSAVGRALEDQFDTGAPSYSTALEWQLPIGRRAATANARRRRLESIQLSERYRSTLELVKAEVEIAVREVNTSYSELSAKDQARLAAKAETETYRVRWESLGGRNNNASLLLESFLDSQERLTQSEFQLAQAQLTYSLSLINLRQANGTLSQAYVN